MSAIDTSLVSLPVSRASMRAAAPQAIFLACGAMLIVASALLAGLAPIGFSIVAVFLFAGPHNWMEARYFLSQMPARWGPLRPFFTLAIGGVILLTAGFLLIPHAARAWRLDAGGWEMLSAGWMSATVLWIAALAILRSRQHPCRDWNWLLPVALLVVAAVWLWPRPWEIGLVYLHPIIAIVFLWRIVSRRRPQWRAGLAMLLAMAAGALGILWWQLHDAPALVGQDMLTMRITHHAGAGFLKNLSPHALVATHTFLEMLHYGVWIAAIPWLAIRSSPLSLRSAPLARRSPAWRAAVFGLMLAGGVAVVVLWGGFLSDYSVTRDIYFAVAIAHVLAEAPFLLRTI